MMEQVAEPPCAWQSEVYIPAQLTWSCVGEWLKSLELGSFVSPELGAKAQASAPTVASVPDQAKQMSLWDADWEEGEAKDKGVKVKSPRCHRNQQLKLLNRTSQGTTSLEKLKRKWAAQELFCGNIQGSLICSWILTKTFCPSLQRIFFVSKQLFINKKGLHTPGLWTKTVKLLLPPCLGYMNIPWGVKRRWRCR